MAEDEIPADDDVTGPQPTEEDGIDEVLRRTPGEVEVEMEDIEVIGAERRDMAGLGAQRRQAERRVIGPEHTPRMGLEGEHAKRCAQIPGDRAGLADEGLVAEMDAVEIADGDDAAPGLRRQILIMAKNTHPARFPFRLRSPSGPEVPYDSWR